MPIAELFLGAFLQVLFDRLASRELLHFARHKGIETLLKNWEDKLIIINRGLDDAEHKQLNGDLSVQPWLERLRKLAYNFEDLLDEFAMESAKNTSKVRFLLPSCLSPRAFMFDHTMESKIKELDDELQHIITLKENLGLIEKNRQQSAHYPQNQPFHTTHLPEEIFIGREDKITEILKLLFREEDNRTCMDKVIAIEGMAGLGKTALAQKVFHHDKVTDYFPVRAWACVSYDFDVASITYRILETTNPKLARELDVSKFSLNGLQNELYNSLLGKRFLIVLDDVWEKNYERWDFLLKPCRLAVEKSEGSKGSKIIVTTRDSAFASKADARQITLKVLSSKDCMTLFERHLLRVTNFDHHHNLEKFGCKMVEKCDGLPLAVKALVGVLRSKDDPSEWEEILDNKFWYIPEGEINILPVLGLSYLDLPSHLRRCFAYCAIFPKDYEIQQDELIHWWIAEGLVEGKEAKNQWDVGLKYFKELVNRSLFLKSSSNGSQFLMHDLVNDLAKLVAGVTCFDLAEFKGALENAYSIRHASFIPNDHILSEKFKIYHRMKGLRSFISLDKQPRSYNTVFVSQKVLCDLLSALEYLRVLSLSHYGITEVPESIGKLRHLRHLNLSYTNIETLPKSIVALYNLEALILQGCENLLELPKGIEKLINLRFLDITNTSNLETMPLYIGKLVGLEMLSKFIVGTENGSRLEELKELKNLRGELCIFDLHMVQHANDAKEANLCEKKGISRLTLQWSRDFRNPQNEELEGEVLESPNPQNEDLEGEVLESPNPQNEELEGEVLESPNPQNEELEGVLEFLCPYQNLKNLTISYYGGLKFPSWLGSPSHDNIVHLRLHGCQKVKALPLLGQLPSLKELYIEDLNAICTVGSEFYGSNSAFPSLTTLEFKGMPLWKHWSHGVDTEEIGVVFPRLEHLVICRCPVLIGRLPSQLSSLIKLEIYSCPRMDASPSITSFPSLNELDFRGCNKGVLKSLVMPSSLTALVIKDVPELTCLYHEFTSSLNKLEKLEIRSCQKLMYLWRDNEVIQDLARLKSLVVESCVEFKSFLAREGDIELPGNLENVELIKCFNLKKLPNKIHTLPSLRRLYIHGCDGLRSLPRGLGIYPDEPSSSTSSNTHSDMTSCLEILRIYECNSLPTSPFNEGRFLPATLKILEIRECKVVESLIEIDVARLQSLQEILIWDCENLRNLPQGLHTLSRLASLTLFKCPALELECFPPLPPDILEFTLWRCPKVKSLPNQLNGLTSLHKLDITYCESITRIPDGGLPPKLQTLSLWGCKNIEQPLREWLTPLTHLEWLLIYGSVGGAGEEEDLELPLPPNLRDLRIFDMERVERLSGNLPPSLRKLLIHDCPNLRDLPRDGLPPFLEELSIEGCEILMERCREPNGDYWSRICEIPSVILEEKEDNSESCVSFPRCCPRINRRLHH